MANPKYPWKLIDGLKASPFFPDESIKSALQYKPKDGDLFLVTFPRSGTNWTHHLIHLIYHKGEAASSPVEFHRGAAFIDLNGATAAEKMIRPGLIMTHFPFERTPFSPQAKYINVVRNPKDCLTSMYHFLGSSIFNSSGEKIDVGTFVDDFAKGNIPSDSYFDHVLSWYNHRNDPNILFLTYEEMKKDIRTALLKIATFIGEEHKETVSDDVIMKKIIDNSDVKSTGKMFDMANVKGKEDELPPKFKEALSTTKFIRKGVTKDWENLLSKEQAAKIDELAKEKFKGTDLLDIWKEYIN